MNALAGQTIQRFQSTVDILDRSLDFSTIAMVGVQPLPGGCSQHLHHVGRARRADVLDIAGSAPPCTSVIALLVSNSMFSYFLATSLTRSTRSPELASTAARVHRFGTGP